MNPTDTLAQTGQAFKQWRQTQLHPSAEIPAELRQAALHLLADFPVPRVAKALGLCSSTLYQWRKPATQRKPVTKRKPAAKRKSPAPATFVELPADQAQAVESARSLSLTLAPDLQLTLHGELSPHYVLQLLAGLRS